MERYPRARMLSTAVVRRDYRSRMSHSVEIARVAPRVIAGVRFDVTDVSQLQAHLRGAFARVAEVAARHGRTLTGPAVALYRTTRAGFDVVAGFALDGEEYPPTDGDVVPVELPGGDVATTTHVGSYESLGEVYEALRAGARAQDRAVDVEGPVWEEYWNEPSTESARTVVFWPLIPA